MFLVELFDEQRLYWSFGVWKNFCDFFMVPGVSVYFELLSIVTDNLKTDGFRSSPRENGTLHIYTIRQSTNKTSNRTSTMELDDVLRQ